MTLPRWLEKLLGIAPQPAAVTVRQRAQARVKPRPALPAGRKVQVERDRRSLLEVRGWKASGSNRYVGAYRTPRGSYAGEIVLRGSGEPDFYIVNPPPAVLTGRHSGCFRSRGGGKFYVHFGRSSPDVDAGIVGIEKLIALALKGEP
jgi:hypothetical protein